MKEETKKENKKQKKDRYELTLAEFPLFELAKSKKNDFEIMEYKDTIIGRDGNIIPRRWRVFPHAELGFPSASGLQTLYDLFQIWNEQGFESQYINFGSIYNLLKLKGLSKGKENYKRVRSDLEKLVGITIQAENAFWDNEVRAYVDMSFHLFERVEFFKDKPKGQAILPYSRIKASDILFGSIIKNSLFITKFDSKFFHSLKPMEQRLALYLSKIFRSQTVHKRELIEFASQIPLQVKQKKLIKQRLKIACQGLIDKEFRLLESFRFEKGKDKNEYIVFKRKGELKKPPELQSGKNKKEQYEIDILVEDILEVCQDGQSENFYKKVARLMDSETIRRALAEVREVRDLGEIKKSKGALFTNLIKKYAQEERIEL